ncbi:alpha/beta hydrolase [Micrococcales bacterium 31B]|nr:alpha/beta hydrolase [Micrococcales bacterium 31B]
MTTRRILGALAAVAAAALVARRARRVLAAAPPLRRAFLWLPLWIPHPRLVPLVRRVTQPREVGDDTAGGMVRTELRRAPGLGTHGPGVPVKIYEPHDGRASRGALLWIHGGGFVTGNLAWGDANAAEIAHELGILVVSVDYRLAPEHPFPAAIDDCMAALSWMHANHIELDIDPRRIAVGGGSAGGGLAACVAQRAHDEGRPVCLQALIYPMLDDRTVLRKGDQDAVCSLWLPLSNRTGWTAYRGSAPDYLCAPEYLAAARREHLDGLPPAWIGVGDLDLFYQEDVDYAARLEEYGVPCDLFVVPGMYHGADQIVMPRPELTDAFIRDLHRALRTALC